MKLHPSSEFHQLIDFQSIDHTFYAKLFLHYTLAWKQSKLCLAQLPFRQMDQLCTLNMDVLRDGIAQWVEILYVQELESNNVPYNPLDWCVDWTNDSLIECLMFQALFFSYFLTDLEYILKTLYFYYKRKKINWNNFCKEFCKKSWKKIILGTLDTWSMSRVGPLTQQPSVSYWRLSNLYIWSCFHATYRKI